MNQFLINLSYIVGILVAIVTLVNIIIIKPTRKAVHNIINPLKDSIDGLKESIDTLRDDTEAENKSIEKRLADHDIELKEHQIKIENLIKDDHHDEDCW